MWRLGDFGYVYMMQQWMYAGWLKSVDLMTTFCFIWYDTEIAAYICKVGSWPIMQIVSLLNFFLTKNKKSIEDWNYVIKYE